MDFGSKEIKCWIIPGIYLLGILALMIIPYLDTDSISSNLKNMVMTESFAAILLFMIPVFGYIIGYIINSIGSFLEYHLYEGLWKINIKRPSSILLNGGYKRSPISNLDNLKTKLCCPQSNIDNKKSVQYLNKAKQSISTNTEKIDYSYTKSIFSRNLFAAQLIALIVAGITIICNYDCNTDKKYELFAIGLYIIMLWIYWKSWRRNCLIYVRDIFIEYLHSK